MSGKMFSWLVVLNYHLLCHQKLDLALFDYLNHEAVRWLSFFQGFQERSMGKCQAQAEPNTGCSILGKAENSLGLGLLALLFT